jgi:Siphovirus Gp157
MNLNELLKQYSLLENDEGELCDDWDQKMDALGDSINQKIDNSCRLAQAFESHADAIQLEIERLKRLKSSYESRAENIKKWLIFCLNGQKTETELYKLSVRKSEAVEILDESLIPPQYLREKVTVTPAKDEIKTDLKLGATIAGATLKQNLSLIIR